MNTASYTDQLQLLRNHFNSGFTRDYSFRVQQLKKLKQAILDREQELYAALYADLKKSKEESWVTELGTVISEINVALKNLRGWMEPERVATNILNLPSRSRVIREPLGVVLIISPWNFPFQLAINPLVGAIAAGNCVVLKPSEAAPATDAVMKKIIEAVFPPEYILYVQGEGVQVIPELMNHFSFNHVLYTGGPAAGKAVYKMAAERLVPVTLELGGKSPAIVEADANIKVAARRIAVTKFTNAGQICVAPDYVLVHQSQKQALLKELEEAIRQFYTVKAEESDSYGKMINSRQFDRVIAYMKQGRIVAGGRSDREKLFIEPTLLTDIPDGADVMNEEIFGPVLPVIGFTESEQAKVIIRQHRDPLAFYVFTSSAKKEAEWLAEIPFGGGCVNNGSWHPTNYHLPFGGRGASGIGKYHGKYSFETFSHQKAVMKTPTWFDPAIKYPPFNGRLKLFKWIIK